MGKGLWQREKSLERLSLSRDFLCENPCEAEDSCVNSVQKAMKNYLHPAAPFADSRSVFAAFLGEIFLERLAYPENFAREMMVNWQLIPTLVCSEKQTGTLTCTPFGMCF